MWTSPVIHQHTNYRKEVEKRPDLPVVGDELLGQIVEPIDGSWSITLINGVMQHQFVACKPTKQWIVLAVNGRFPTEYYRRMNYDTDKYDYNIEGELNFYPDSQLTNDVMMVALDNPNEITFINHKFLRVV